MCHRKTSTEKNGREQYIDSAEKNGKHSYLNAMANPCDLGLPMLSGKACCPQRTRSRCFRVHGRSRIELRGFNRNQILERLGDFIDPENNRFWRTSSLGKVRIASQTWRFRACKPNKVVIPELLRIAVAFTASLEFLGKVGFYET
jgi:hypothetical protein